MGGDQGEGDVTAVHHRHPHLTSPIKGEGSKRWPRSKLRGIASWYMLMYFREPLGGVNQPWPSPIAANLTTNSNITTMGRKYPASYQRGPHRVLWCSRRDSNARLWLRRPTLYPPGLRAPVAFRKLPAQFLPVRDVKTIQMLNFLTPHVFLVFGPWRAALKWSETHTLMQLIIAPQKATERRLPLIISMLHDKDYYGIALAFHT